MNEYISQIKSWYEQRILRERLLAIALTWAAIYAVFTIFLFRPLNDESQLLKQDIKATKNQIGSWNTQIDALNKIDDSPLYKEWQKQHQTIENIEGQSVFLKNSTSSKQWGEVIKTVLQSQNNITLEQVKNFPETIYNPLQLQNIAMKIYQQQLLVVVYSNYFDTINYIQRLEQVLPNLRWDSIHYQVIQYPVGKVEMEFSILYEKEA